MSSNASSIDRLKQRVNSNWPAIDASVTVSQEKKKELLSLFSEAPKLDSEDRSIVAFGSIGRNEWTTGSDLDWTLLIDGQADPAHLQTAQRIRDDLATVVIKKPGPTGVFGNMAFSHDIIHRIGGENDTNTNMTQRILLLLESIVIGSNSDAYDRVIRGILNRYLEEETSFSHSSERPYGVPRFLLNDIVRFWRTMAVDFANKQRERAGVGWGLRNTKLRMSRKLIFAAGLLICFDCELGTPQATLLEHLLSLTKRTPLEILADAVLTYGTDECAVNIFSAYDQFLTMLGDTAIREHLDKLTAHHAQHDPVFQEVRKISHAFRDGLSKLFFETKGLSELTIEYGVF